MTFAWFIDTYASSLATCASRSDWVDAVGVVVGFGLGVWAGIIGGVNIKAFEIIVDKDIIEIVISNKQNSFFFIINPYKVNIY